MNIETTIGLRYLRSKRKGAFITFTTWIAVLGIAIGVMALIVVIAVMTGFQEEIRNRILGINPHILILSKGGEIKNVDKIVRSIKDEKGVTNAFPFAQFQALIQGREQHLGVIVKAVNPEDVEFLKGMIKLGKIEALKEKGKVLIGKELSRQLGLYLEQEFFLIVPHAMVSPAGLSPDILPLKVGGIIETGIYDVDNVMLIMSLNDLQSFALFGVTGIEVRLKDVYRANEMRDMLVSKLGNRFFGRTWVEMNRNLFSALKLEKIAMFIILALIILVASFNIISSLVMTVMEKKKDIAILKSFGAKKRTIMKIFIIEGLAIGLVGIFFGSLFGYGLCEIIRKYKIVSLPQDIYYITNLPAKITLLDVFLVISVTVLICLFSTIYPSYRASRMEPQEALRYE